MIKHTDTPEVARVAGEEVMIDINLFFRRTELSLIRFTMITGAQLADDLLEGGRPDNFESGPSDNPEDENVDMGPDDGLPWPNVEKVEA